MSKFFLTNKLLPNTPDPGWNGYPAGPGLWPGRGVVVTAGKGPQNSTKFTSRYNPVYN
jgi:hypothetical protein